MPLPPPLPNANPNQERLPTSENNDIPLKRTLHFETSNETGNLQRSHPWLSLGPLIVFIAWCFLVLIGFASSFNTKNFAENQAGHNATAASVSSSINSAYGMQTLLELLAGIGFAAVVVGVCYCIRLPAEPKTVFLLFPILIYAILCSIGKLALFLNLVTDNFFPIMSMRLGDVDLGAILFFVAGWIVSLIYLQYLIAYSKMLQIGLSRKTDRLTLIATALLWPMIIVLSLLNSAAEFNDSSSDPMIIGMNIVVLILQTSVLIGFGVLSIALYLGLKTRMSD